MNQALVIVTHPANERALDVLLASIPWTCRYPVCIVINEAVKAKPTWILRLAQYGTLLYNYDNRYELGAIERVLEDTDIDEFVLLQDTFEIKDIRFLDTCFARRESVALGPAFFHYAGKWKRSVLNGMAIPKVTSKYESVRQEGVFTRQYIEREDVWVLDEHFHDGEHKGFVEMFGRTNMLLENDFYIKRKGDWGQRPL
jgi:hypothetical protein